MLWLIKLWLKAPIEERDGDGKPRMSGGKGSTRGTPQGGVASPLLSVIYMNRFLKHWRLTGRGEAFRAHVISYADDVRHITRCWIPFAERRGLEDMTPGPTAYPAAKAKGDRSMPSKRERSEDADDPVPQGPRDTVRTGLFEPQSPAMQAYIPRHSVLRRGHRDRATKIVVARTFHAVGDGTSSHSRGRTRHLRRARHVQHHGNVGSPDAPRGAG